MTALLSQAGYRPGLRLLIFCIVIVSLQPPPLLVTPGPARTVATRHPIMGVHTRLTDEVEPWKIKRTLELVREMGAPWIVEFFPWAYYQSQDGHIDWTHPDLVIDHATAQGLTIIARLGLTPWWARPDETPLQYLAPSAYDDFAAFAAAFAARYRGRVAHIIIWNEPNLAFEWGYQPNSPADYTALLQTVYPAIKAANPEAIILGGALAPTLEPAGSPWGLNDLVYLQGMYDAGADAYFDALAVHSYGLTFPALAEPAPDILNFRRVELVREIMVNNGDGNTPIYITETGWNDHPRWTMAVSPASRIENSLAAFEHAESAWPYVKAMAIWAFRFPAPARSYPDYFTLVTPEFVTKPIYDALKAYALQ